MTRKLYRFHGGIHLEPRKELSNTRPITSAVVPKRLHIPLQQHVGEPAEPIVKPGDYVLKGQMVAKASAYVSVPVHASSSGTVVEIADHPVPHASGLAAPTLVIETDGKDQWIERKPVTDYRALDLSELRNRIRNAGIVGLGGAAFPSFIKLNPGPKKKLDTLVLNGAECEPYITCDDLLMRERPDQVIAGARVLMHAVQADRCLIGIEDNKPEAIAALTEAAAGDPDIEVVAVPTVYPTGGEKQLIWVLTGREVPSHGLPLDVGVVCLNVGTATAVHRAVNLGEPLISRIVTFSGTGIAQPRNLEVLIGTPVNELVEQCGGYKGEVARLIMGGPMMGFTLSSDHIPLVKAINAVLALAPAEVPASGPSMPCVRCMSCVEVCPTNLLPQQLYWNAHSKNFEATQDYNLFDCIECGCCAYVCPSHLPLVQYYRFAKTEIWAKERERKKADRARERAEFRKARHEREEQERAARLAAKKAAAKPAAGKAPAAAHESVSSDTSTTTG